MMEPMYLTFEDHFCIIKESDGSIPTVKKGEAYMAEMGTLKPFMSYENVIGLTGEELLNWLHDRGYKRIQNDAELAKLMLCLN